MQSKPTAVSLLVLLLAATGSALADNLGQQAWGRAVVVEPGQPARSCADCHGTDLRQAGKHLRTGKRIDPMAPSVNPERLQDPEKIEKWFKRNCRWTWGRECNALEKTAFLQFIRQQ